MYVLIGAFFCLIRGGSFGFEFKAWSYMEIKKTRNGTS